MAALGLYRRIIATGAPVRAKTRKCWIWVGQHWVDGYKAYIRMTRGRVVPLGNWAGKRKQWSIYGERTTSLIPQRTSANNALLAEVQSLVCEKFSVFCAKLCGKIISESWPIWTQFSNFPIWKEDRNGYMSQLCRCFFFYFCWNNAFDENFPEACTMHTTDSCIHCTMQKLKKK